MASVISLSEGSVAAMYQNQSYPSPLVQILELKKLQGSSNQAPPSSSQQERFKLSISDGIHCLQAMLASQLHHLVKENNIEVGCVVRLNDYLCNAVHGRRIAFILNMDIVSPPLGIIGHPISIEPPSTNNTSAPVPSPVVSQQQPQPMGRINSNNAPPPSHSNVNQYRPAPNTTNNATPSNNYQQQQRQVPQQQHHQQNPFANTTSARPLDSSIHPIKSLNPYQNRWTIKARVTAKSDIKTFNTQKGTQGSLFSVDLLDSSGGEIKATMFSDAVEKWFTVLQQGQVYYISGGKLKPANKKFSSLKNEYELTLDANSVIQLCPDPSDIPQNHFSFTPIASIQDCIKDEVIDVIGVVLQMDGVDTITSKGNQLSKRNVLLGDDTCCAIELTLWGARAENPGFTFEDQPILALKSVKVSEYKGHSLTSVSSTLIEPNPDAQRAHQLRGWYDTHGATVQWNRLSKANFKSNGGMGEGGPASARVQERKTFSQIKDDSMTHATQVNEFMVKGTVTIIKHELPIWYIACAKQGCSKKVTEVAPGQWHCDKCNETQNSCQPRYMLSFSASDHTGSAWLNAFNDVGKTILSGNEASVLANLKDNNALAYEDVFQQAVFKQYKFKIRAKVENYNGVDRVRCNVFWADPVNWAEESRWMLQQIKRFG